MIIYESTKSEFVNDVLYDAIAIKIHGAIKEKFGNVSEKEVNSWNNSMEYMNKVLNTSDIPDECGVAIEYKIPRTNNRIDFILTGFNDEDKGSAVVVELKQWDKTVEAVLGKDGIIKTQYYSGRELTHPSYQALSYTKLITDYNETVRNDQIGLYPCAYLHNYFLEKDDPINHAIYSDYTTISPVFVKGDAVKLREFICKYIKKPDHKKILYIIENGKIRPSKSLQDALTSMIDGNEEFTMVESQKVVYEEALSRARKSFSNSEKNVLIVEGGPGTGKSVLAINLLVKLTAEELVCQYITKNTAPRQVYLSKLKKNHKKAFIDNLFKGSGSYFEVSSNEFDALVVDEAHRLGEKSGMFKNKGFNQTKEIINASKFSVFFIDENQRIHIDDAGRKDEIIKFSKLLGANVQVMKLESQFRCNGSDSYIAWLDDLLEIRETANDDAFDFDYDFKIFDDPNKLKNAIYEKNKMNNKSRIVAGYCWRWDKSERSNMNHYDIDIPEFEFKMSWNLGSTSTWAIDEESIKQAGCIHTSQGLEFDYVGVIIGDDLRFENNNIVTDFTKRATTDQSLKGIKTLYKSDKEKALKIADEIIKNTYRTLMTRGQKGCYIYCSDKNLAKYIKGRLNKNYEYQEYMETKFMLKKVAEDFGEYGIER